VVRRVRAWTAAVLLMGWMMGGTGCRAEPWGLWQAYCRSFVDAQGRVVDHQNGDRTTSEGQAYAMFFALVANDRAEFDRLLAWTRDNLAQGNLATHRLGWEWGRAADGEWKLLDGNSAADADLWMCYALTEAGRLWNNAQYTALGKTMEIRIEKDEVASLPGFGPMLLPGTDGFHPSADTWVLNPSYVPLPLVERMAGIDPSGPWSTMARELPEFLRASAPQGFAMDWVSYTAAKGFAPDVEPGVKTGAGANAKAAPLGSFDAIRVYLWAGMSSTADPETHTALAAVDGMGTWLKEHPYPPEQVSAAGVPGTVAGPVGFSAALLPYLTAMHATTALRQQEERMEGQRNPATELYGNPPAYYDQNLAMFGEGWTSHRFRFDREGELRVTWKK